MGILASAVLTLALLDGLAGPPDAWCPVAAPPDVVVSCPGWRPRPARTRDRKGTLIRSSAVVQEFKTATGYPHGRPGFVADHLRPLCAGGNDVPWNLTWQRVVDAKAKDRQEVALCRRPLVGPR